MKTVIVTGASSLIGYFLLPRLVAGGYRVIAVGRNQMPAHLSGLDIEQWLQLDINVADSTAFPDADLLIHLAPLWFLPCFLDAIPNVAKIRVIAFSSTSRLAKLNSVNPSEQETAKKLALAEDQLIAKQNSRVTIFRPTLIYGAGLDKNVSSIARMIKRFKIFPLVGNATGKRQPVHADDLAQACLLAAKEPATEGKIYELVGGETLSYRDMVSRIFQVLNQSPRFFRLPLAVTNMVIRVMRVVPKYRHLTPQMVSRMNDDLVFNSSSAVKDFGYQAIKFTPSFEYLNDQ